MIVRFTKYKKMPKKGCKNEKNLKGEILILLWIRKSILINLS